MHKQPEIISNLPRGIIGANIQFIRHGVVFELSQLTGHLTELHCISHPEYLSNGQFAIGHGQWNEDRYVFAEIGRVLQMGNHHVVDTHLHLPPAIHAIRTKMLDDYYNFDLKGSIGKFNEGRFPNRLVARMPGKQDAVLYYLDYNDVLDQPDDSGNFVSKGSKIRWFCRNYESLKGLFT
jgi:hypothetical protein